MGSADVSCSRIWEVETVVRAGSPRHADRRLERPRIASRLRGQCTARCGCLLANRSSLLTSLLPPPGDLPTGDGDCGAPHHQSAQHPSAEANTPAPRASCPPRFRVTRCLTASVSERQPLPCCVRPCIACSVQALRDREGGTPATTPRGLRSRTSPRRLSAPEARRGLASKPPAVAATSCASVAHARGHVL